MANKDNNNPEESEVRFHEDSQIVISHLGIIQNIIQRMAGNSASCKSWCITIVSAIFVLIPKENISYIWIALVPITLFAILDGYYLGYEKAFVKSYNDFINKLHMKELVISDIYSIKPPKDIGSFMCESFKSFSVLPFYAVLIALSVLIFFSTKN